MKRHDIYVLIGIVLGAVSPIRAEELTFEKHIRPILKAHCFYCHGEEEKPKAKLDVRLPSLMIKGGKSGPALVPGKPDESRIWEMVHADEMPEGSKKLSAKEKETLKTWIASGAKMARPEPKNLEELRITEEERSFWAFQPVRVTTPHRLAEQPIDAFILQKLQQEKLAPNPVADRRTLIRRLYFDLLGLPPSPKEVDEFLRDSRPDAYEKLVDRLLASPHYGEHWARHWLDVAGYAESDGVTNEDKERPHAWRYRDYVVQSLNKDKPYDRFLIEQLAGDELITRRPLVNLTAEETEALSATAFLRMAPDATEVDNSMVERNNAVAETIKVVGSAILGLTVGCAQCHDHRYDPISIADYYRLRAVFDPAFPLKDWKKPSQRLVNLTPEEIRKKRDAIEAQAKAKDKEIRDYEITLEDQVFEQEIVKIPEEDRQSARTAFFAAKRTPDQEKLLKKYIRLDIRHRIDLYDPKGYAEVKKRRAEVAKLRETKPPEVFYPVTYEESPKVPESYVFFRGDHESPRQKVLPGELPILALQRSQGDIALKNPDLPSSGRRLAYARMLVDGKHPLVARVAVNRIWAHHFGRGLVATPGDFGAFGERPSHPELLDWLADDFVRHGWKVKRLHKQILMSETYRRTPTRRPEQQQVDPDNRWLARSTIRRLSAEQIRDAILSVSGKLVRETGGVSTPVAEDGDGMPVLGKRKLNEGLFAGIEPPGDQQFRRSIYLQVRRKLPLPMMEAFDLPVMKPNCDARRCTTVAPQSLMLMNNEFVIRQSEELAERVSREASEDTRARVQYLYQLLFATEPPSGELDKCVTYLKEQAEYFRTHGDANWRKNVEKWPHAPDLRALATLGQVLMGSNRFLYVD